MKLSNRTDLALIVETIKLIKYFIKGLVMKTVSEQEKAKSLLSLTEEDVNEASYKFIQGTIKSLAAGNHLDKMSDRQAKWFGDLYDKHFGD